MASQYRKIEDFPGVLWGKESPVALEKMRLARDTFRGVNVLQLTFRNVCNTNIYGLSISITMKDFSGKKVLKKDIEYHYYGMEVGINKTFGADDYIFVEPEGKSFQITVKRAEFSDGANFRGSVLLEPMPECKTPDALGEFEDPFKERILADHPKVKILAAPEDKLQYWYCSCGRFYPHIVQKCPACNLRKEEIFQVLADLKAKKQDGLRAAALAEKARLEEEERLRREAEEKRLREEELERQRQEEEAERKRLLRKKIRKFTTAGAGIVTVCILLLLFWPGLRNEQTPIDPAESGKEVMSETTPEPLPTPDPVPTPEPVVEPTPKPEAMPVAILGEDLTDEDMRLVLRLIGMEQDDFDRFEVIYVSSEEELDYLSGRYDSDLLGGKSLSSLLITETEPGTGLQVTTYNITYCTEEMYKELLLESGITDAEVVVAAPFKMSGTAALAGILKAGEYIEGRD